MNDDSSQKSLKGINIGNLTVEKKESIITEVNHSHSDAYRFFPIFTLRSALLFF